MTKKYICGNCRKPFKSKAIMDKHKRENCKTNTIQTQIIRDKDNYSPKIKDRIEKLTKIFDWIKQDKEGVLEIFADNHILSTFRTCEAKFQEEIVNNIIPKGGNWSLSFGIAFHKWMEWFDEAEDKNFEGVWNDYPTSEEISEKYWKTCYFSKFR